MKRAFRHSCGGIEGVFVSSAVTKDYRPRGCTTETCFSRLWGLGVWEQGLDGWVLVRGLLACRCLPDPPPPPNALTWRREHSGVCCKGTSVWA